MRDPDLSEQSQFFSHFYSLQFLLLCGCWNHCFANGCKRIQNSITLSWLCKIQILSNSETSKDDAFTNCQQELNHMTHGKRTISVVRYYLLIFSSVSTLQWHLKFWIFNLVQSQAEPSSGYENQFQKWMENLTNAKISNCSYTASKNAGYLAVSYRYDDNIISINEINKPK